MVMCNNNKTLISPRQWARRSDAFALPKGAAPAVELDIEYTSGITEGKLILTATQGVHLDGMALLLLGAIVTLARDPANSVYITSRATGDRRRYVRTTPYDLAKLALGHPASGREYRRLGLVPSDKRTEIGALQALRSVVIEANSVLLSPDGQKYNVETSYNLIDGYRWWQSPNDGREMLYIALSTDIWQAILMGALVTIPPGIRSLGARNAAALRLTHFILSHSPLPGKSKRRGKAIVISAMAVGPVLGWASLMSQRRRAQYIRHLHAMVADIAAVDDDHHWRLIRAAERAWAWKIVVYPKK